MRCSWAIVLFSAFFVLSQSCRPKVPLSEIRTSQIETSIYQTEIQPIFDKNCVSCHACYQSPCQVNLTSFTGLMRGASKLNVYGKRVVKEDPVRLYIDATKASDWHNNGFWPVVQQGEHQQSILWQMLDLKQEFPNEPIAENTENALLSRHACPQITDGVAAFRSHYREASAFDVTPLDLARPDKRAFGMPYGFPALKQSEVDSIKDWINSGGKGPTADEVIAATQPQSPLIRKAIDDWEAILNGNEIKDQLIARYLYEHWFMAHLYFGNGVGDPITGGNREFFEIVRAVNRRGVVHGVSRSRHPYDPFDSNGSKFFYRIRKVQGTIVHKTHITYELSDRRLNRLKDLFYNENWDVATLPPYGEAGSNPFTTFAAIPPLSRYLFLLDDAEYFTRADIRGPVCSGQLAVNVIQDQGWKLFVDPNFDLSVTEPEFFQTKAPGSNSTIAELLALPAYSQRSLGDGLTSVTEYLKTQQRYRETKDKIYQRLQPRSGMNRIWMGQSQPVKVGGETKSYEHGAPVYEGAVLTVFRNFDNAVVIPGLIGELPKTAELIDFPILERTYYNLVAGFDVFAATQDGVNTRSYKNALRIESEYNFLQMFPRKARRPIWDYWYSSKFGTIGEGALRMQMSVFNNLVPDPDEEGRESLDVDQFGDLPVDNGKRLSDTILLRVANKIRRANLGPQDPINCLQCTPVPIASHEDIIKQFANAVKEGDFVQYFPELAFIALELADGSTLPFTMIANRFRTHLNTLIREDQTRVPEKDTLVFLQGYVGSYPNMFYTVAQSNLASFLSEMRNVRSKEGWKDFARRFQGVLRDSPKIFDVAHQAYEKVLQTDPVEAGRYDLSRYELIYR